MYNSEKQEIPPSSREVLTEKHEKDCEIVWTNKKNVYQQDQKQTIFERLMQKVAQIMEESGQLELSDESSRSYEKMMYLIQEIQKQEQKVKNLEQDGLDEWPEQYSEINREKVKQYGGDIENMMLIGIFKAKIFPEESQIVFTDWVMERTSPRYDVNSDVKIKEPIAQEKKKGRMVMTIFVPKGKEGKAEGLKWDPIENMVYQGRAESTSEMKEAIKSELKRLEMTRDVKPNMFDDQDIDDYVDDYDNLELINNETNEMRRYAEELCAMYNPKVRKKVNEVNDYDDLILIENEINELSRNAEEHLVMYNPKVRKKVDEVGEFTQEPSRREKNHYGRDDTEKDAPAILLSDELPEQRYKFGNGKRKRGKKEREKYLEGGAEEKQSSIYQMYGQNIIGYERKETNWMNENLVDINLIEPREHKSGNLDCECVAQTIDHHSTVVVPCAAAERKDMNKNHIGRQIRDVERFNLSCDGKTCLLMETGLKTLIEEENQLNRFWRTETRETFVDKEQILNQKQNKMKLENVNKILANQF
jgi:hypothetical protein